MDSVFRGARTIDPETGLDTICDVGILGGEIAVVSEGADPNLRGRVELDVSGRVLAPGFIDLHSHCRDFASRALQVCDGVTTALELEAGEMDVAGALAEVSREGSPNHYGFSASWGIARMAVCGLDVRSPDDPFMQYLDSAAWHRELSMDESSALLDSLSRELDSGAIGIGVLLGYCQETSADEYLRVAALAADTGSATFTHVRELPRADSGYFGAAEVVSAALATGAHMHICHVNSTSLRNIDRVNDLVARGRDQGLRVTVEAYPYGAGCTGIGAEFLAPEALAPAGLQPSDIRYLPTGEQVRTAERLAELRSVDPGGLVVVDFLRETDPADLAFLTRAFVTDDTAVASDAMPLVPPAGTSGNSSGWPIEPGTLTHPRTSGTYSRVLRWYVRELGLVDLVEGIRRATLVPAEILRDLAPDMRRKGRVQVGADADLVVFDAEAITDRATYADPTATSSGIDHVMVSGELVVRDGNLQPGVRPGRAVRGTGSRPRSRGRGPSGTGTA
jgi:hypothetical protein